MALVPIIQPPIMRALTTQAEREITMVQLREVSKAEKIVFPLLLLLLIALLLPSAAASVRNVLLRQFNEGVWCSRSLERYDTECVD